MSIISLISGASLGVYQDQTGKYLVFEACARCALGGSSGEYRSEEASFFRVFNLGLLKD